jgi:aminoglycoside phosphotransferase (APT) family kinase protein
MEESPRQRAAAALRAHLPELADVPVLEFGHGLDNKAFVAADLILRVADGLDVTREAGLLEVVAPRVSLPVPVPRFVDADGGVLAYPLIPGRSLLGRVPPAGAATRLGRFLHELHGINPSEVTDLVPVEDADPHEWLEGLEGPPDLVSLLHTSVPPPGDRRVLAHADLGAEHVLERDGRLTGVIDWSDGAVTDPGLDFARLYRDFGPVFLAEALDAYGGLEGGGSAMARIEFYARCAALEDLTYSRDSGRREYADAAERSLTWLFPRIP